MYLQPDVSKVNLVPPADSSKPYVRICGALRSLVNLFCNISGVRKKSECIGRTLTTKSKMFLSKENSGRLVIQSLAGHEWSKAAVSPGPTLFRGVVDVGDDIAIAAVFC